MLNIKDGFDKASVSRKEMRFKPRAIRTGGRPRERSTSEQPQRRQRGHDPHDEDEEVLK
jgi:hypothetical protein